MTWPRKVRDGEPIDLASGHVNVIWQGDANAMALRCFEHCTVPAAPINVSGPETVSIRTLAAAFGERLGQEPVFHGRGGTRQAGSPTPNAPSRSSAIRACH